MSVMIRFFALWLFFVPTAYAAKLAYNLEPQSIAKNTWVLQGKSEDFSKKNGGNIVNTAFIVTEEGVVVFDTGPSRRYGEAMRKAIAAITDKPIILVLNSHHHPDHFLGNQAFADVPIKSLPETGKQIAQHGNVFAENMYRLVGDWMRSTEVQLPSGPLDVEYMQVGGHNLRFIQMTGHSGADLVMLDETTGVLFASDMIFFRRALTTPHTPGLDIWLSDLATLASLKYDRIVPGHGPLDTGHQSITEMVDYIRWLDATLKQAAEQGLSMNEVMSLPIDERFKTIALAKSEFVRTVFHLYAKYEAAQF